MEPNHPISASSSSAPIENAAPLSSQVREAQDNRVEGRGERIRFNLPSGGSYRFNFSISDASSADMHDDVWSCLIVLLTFWFFASTTMILGFYGSVSLKLGPNCSRLLHANPFFVQSIKVVEVDEPKPGPLLYGFDYLPTLDVEVAWYETHEAYLPPDLHKEWIYFLNGGSELNISCSVTSMGSTSVHIVVAESRESLVGWIHNPTYPNSTLLWNIINGSGEVRLKVSQSSSYFVAVGNLNAEEVQVKLNFSLKALQYNTTHSNFMCSVDQNLCKLSLFLTGRNIAVLNTPPPGPKQDDINWDFKISYGPRWIAYIVGSGIMTVALLLAFKLCVSLPDENRPGYQPQGGADDTRPEQTTPLLSRKDEDSCSWGSSYDSISPDEEAAFVGGNEGENGGGSSGGCIICFDAPRDCFFLPCGHHATCFTCGTRIAEEDGACPICRRKMRRVRRIYSV